MITWHLVPFFYLLFLSLPYSLKTEGALSCRGNPLPPPLFCFSTIFLHFNKITIYSVQSFILLCRSSAREISCLTRILMTKTWLSSEAARGPSRARTLVDICVQDQGLTCIHEEPQWTGWRPSLVKYVVLDTYKIYMLSLVGGEEAWDKLFLLLLPWQKELESWVLTVSGWNIGSLSGIVGIYKTEGGSKPAWNLGWGEAQRLHHLLALRPQCSQLYTVYLVGLLWGAEIWYSRHLVVIWPPV